jgi:hypothetical protein
MKPRAVITPFVVVAVVIGLLLLVVMYDQDFSEDSITASLMILGFVVFGVGGILYTGRAIWKWPAGQTARYLLWERSFVIAALLLSILGLVLLEDMLHKVGDSGIARVGLVTSLLGVVVVVVAETTFLDNREWNYPQVVLYVVLAFLAQAAYGVGLIQTELVADWVGWFVIVWNLAWLMTLIMFSPHNLYFPVLHHVAPLIIGIALLVQG